MAVVTGGSGVSHAGLGGDARRSPKPVCASRSSGAKPIRWKRAGREAWTKLGAESCAIQADCLDRPSLEKARTEIGDRWGRVDFLLNYAGGNRPGATTAADRPFFGLPQDQLEAAVGLNLLGTILPCQVFGQVMADRGEGAILNISSMAASRPLTRIVGYSAAKAAVDNFTRWLAVYCAKEYSPKIRVNALAPGFFLTEQNRFLLTDEKTGEPTERGRSILQHTPMARFGAADDLTGALLWLLSPASAFVTGIVLPIDGGFSAFSGV